MNYKDQIKVELIAITPLSTLLIEEAGRLCYNSIDKLGTKDNWVQGRIKAGHESIIEHASASFKITASRVFTHEIVRHRIASYSQRSQRYVNESKPQYIIPNEIEGNSDIAITEFLAAMDSAWNSYRRLLSLGIKPEIARYVLPNACQTEIICTWNFREIRHIIHLRTSPAALPEMRCVAGKIKELITIACPEVFGDL